MKKIILTLSCTLLIVLFGSCGGGTQYEYFGTLYGTVSDHETGESVANASVVLSPGGKTKTTGADGIFEFKDLEPQQYTITVQKSGYKTNRKTVTAIVGEKIEANIPLTKN